MLFIVGQKAEIRVKPHISILLITLISGKNYYCLYPNDGKGNVFTGVCPFTEGGRP